MSDEYISREAVNQVVLNRINANSICLNGAKKDKLFEEEKYFSALLLEDGQIKSLVEDIPSTDIMECARAIKEYCYRKKCDKCLFKSKDPMYICSLSHEVPYFWDLPEGEKGGEEV